VVEVVAALDSQAAAQDKVTDLSDLVDLVVMVEYPQFQELLKPTQAVAPAAVIMALNPEDPAAAELVVG
jgi:hypothetical protein